MQEFFQDFLGGFTQRKVGIIRRENESPKLVRI